MTKLIVAFRNFESGLIMIIKILNGIILIKKLIVITIIFKMRLITTTLTCSQKGFTFLLAYDMMYVEDLT